jgi:hypothetical protein
MSSINALGFFTIFDWPLRRTRERVAEYPATGMARSAFHWASIIRLLIVAIVGILLWSDASRAGDDGIIEIYEYWGTYALNAPPPDMKPIILQTPEAFRYGRSKGATRNWGLNFLTFYPSFSSPAAPENAAFIRDCVGDCNGRILVAISNRSHAIHNPGITRGVDYPNMGDYMTEGRLKNLTPTGGTITKLGPQQGFDSGYEVRIPPNDGVGGQVKRYLFHLSEDRVHYDLLAECEENKFARTCTLHFSLKCNPAIYVQVVAIDAKHLDELMDVTSKTEQFVTSMVRVPACQ